MAPVCGFVVVVQSLVNENSVKATACMWLLLLRCSSCRTNKHTKQSPVHFYWHSIYLIIDNRNKIQESKLQFVSCFGEFINLMLPFFKIFALSPALCAQKTSRAVLLALLPACSTWSSLVRHLFKATRLLYCLQHCKCNSGFVLPPNIFWRQLPSLLSLSLLV
jgi:hypothetical protein